MRWQSVVGLLLLLIGGVSYFYVPFLIPGLGWIDLPRVPGQPVYQLHAVALMAPGLAMGLGVALSRPFLDAEWDAPDRASDLAGATVIVVTVAFSALLLAAVVTGQVSPVTAGVVLVMGTITLLVALHTLASIRQSEGVAFDSHWGGLGGGLGGWRLSSAATLILLLAVFASATIGAALYGPSAQTEAPGAGDSGDKDKEPKSPAEKAAATPAAKAPAPAAPAAKDG